MQRDEWNLPPEHLQDWISICSSVFTVMKLSLSVTYWNLKKYPIMSVVSNPKGEIFHIDDKFHKIRSTSSHAFCVILTIFAMQSRTHAFLPKCQTISLLLPHTLESLISVPFALTRSTPPHPPLPPSFPAC